MGLTSGIAKAFRIRREKVSLSSIQRRRMAVDMSGGYYMALQHLPTVVLRAMCKACSVKATVHDVQHATNLLFSAEVNTILRQVHPSVKYLRLYTERDGGWYVTCFIFGFFSLLHNISYKKIG